MTSVSTIRMGFLESDDRLLLDFVYPDETMTLLITRRITRRMIQGLAQMLANSNAAMARVPASHKTEMLIWEHLSARQLGEGCDAGPAAEQPPRKKMPWPLLQKLDVTAQKGGFCLSFQGSDGVLVTLDTNRGELHRLLASLRQLARHAEWGLDTAVGWLVEADSPTMRPGSLAS
jgi:hypothetical protein